MKLRTTLQGLALFSMAPLLPACIVGPLGHYDLKRDLNSEQLKQLREREPGSRGEGEMFYSIPLLPIFAGFTSVYESKNPATFHAMDVDSILLGVPYGSYEEAYWDSQGRHLGYHQDWTILLGLPFRHWSGWKTVPSGKQLPLGGFSIAWGLFKKDGGPWGKETSILWGALKWTTVYATDEAR